MSNTYKHDKFEGANFHTWQTKVKFVLMRKGLWGIVNGKEKIPNTREEKAIWMSKDEKALAIIALGLSDTYIHHIDGRESSHEAWNTLDTLFGAQAKNSKISLLIKFFELNMNIDESLPTHLNYMKSILTQLAGIKKVIEEDVIIAVLLKSLPQEGYSNIVTTLTNLPAPKLVDIEASLLDEYNKLKKRQIFSEEAFYSKGGYKSKAKGHFKGNFQKDLSKRSCSFCGKNNHEEKDCFHRNKAQKAFLADEADEDEAVKNEAEVSNEANFVAEQDWAF